MIEKEFGRTGKILVQGHRGALGYAPENTLPSFKLGYEMGSDILELDVHLSSDNHLIVMHDPEVSRTTDGFGRIADMTLEEIKELDAGIRFDESYAGTKVPELCEVLTWAHDTIDLVIEIKGDPFPTEGIERLLIEEITRYDMLEHVMIISFYHECIRKIKELSSIPTGILYTGCPINPVQMALDARADSIRCDWKYLAEKDTSSAHKIGLWVSCWGADTEDLYERMAKIGVDSIGSNYPDHLRSWLDQRNLGIRKRKKR